MQSKIYAEHLSQRIDNNEIKTISNEFKLEIDDELVSLYNCFEVSLENNIRNLKEGLAEAKLRIDAINTTHDKMADLYTDEQIDLYIQRAKEKVQGLLKKAHLITMK